MCRYMTESDSDFPQYKVTNASNKGIQDSTLPVSLLPPCRESVETPFKIDILDEKIALLKAKLKLAL